ncbi:DUF2303 family protein [Cupriavidus metallidurans]
MQNAESSNIEAALNAGAALAAAKTIGNTPVIVVPEGYRAEEFEHLLPAPTRHRGTTTLTQAESFTRFIKEFSGLADLTPRLYYQIDPHPSFTAILNDHCQAPDWRDFRAVYSAPLSKEWQTWCGFR